MADRRLPLWTNWGRNFTCRPDWLLQPVALEDICEIVRWSHERGLRVRPVGSGYSYTPLVQTDRIMLSLDRFEGIERVDRDAGYAVVRAGTRLRRVMDLLAAQGLAFENLGDIDRQTLAGAAATGTHGTGIGLGNISTQILDVDMVTANGEVVRCAPDVDEAQFKAAQVSLGALGVMARMKMRVVPMYYLRIEKRKERFEDILANLDQNVKENRNFEFFWLPDVGLTYSKRMNLVDPGSAKVGRNPLAKFAHDLVAENAVVWAFCEASWRWPGVRNTCLSFAEIAIPNETAVHPANRAYATPRLVRHHEIEYALPAECAAQVLTAIAQMVQAHPIRTLFPIEVRFVRGDDIFLSPCFGRDVVYVAVHTYIKEDYAEYFARYEEIFLHFGGRPHWGKLHWLKAADLEARYPRWRDFMQVRQTMDADGVFENGYLRQIIEASSDMSLR